MLSGEGGRRPAQGHGRRGLLGRREVLAALAALVGLGLLLLLLGGQRRLSSEGAAAPGERGGGAEGGGGAASLTSTDTGGFDAALAERLEERPRVLVIFSAGPDPEKSWCPVCRLVVPPAQRLAAKAGYVVLRVNVGDDKPTWRNPEHPLRKDPRLRLQYVPTLVWASGDGAFGPTLGSVEECIHAPEGRRACVTRLLEEFLLLRS